MKQAAIDALKAENRKLKAAAKKAPAGADARHATVTFLRVIAQELQDAINSPHPNDVSQFARIKDQISTEADDLEKD